MNKTIECIDKKIEQVKESITDFTLPLAKILLKKELQTLEQIKCELEAWEVMKKRLIRKKYGVFRSKDCSVHNYTRIYLKEIKEDEDTEEYQTIKKALEVDK